MNLLISIESQGGEIRVQTGRINVNRRHNGDTQIETNRIGRK